ncbi:MAG TPA: alkaline phosphatase family protein [Pyrinomonadaceae bacterium]
MAVVNNTRVLAIAVDAAEQTFVRDLMDRDELPALKSLLSKGQWLRVKSPAHLGSGSVWPTFIVGQSPSVHGVYGEWLWDATTMSVSRYDGTRVAPFWKTFVDDGFSVGVLDIPFMPSIGISNGFEISEWGAHDVVDMQTHFAPVSIENTLARHSPHPLQTRLDVSGPADYRALEQVGNICLNGITKRGELSRDLLAETQPQLALIAFSEIHHASHHLWHKVEPGHPAYREAAVGSLTKTHPSIRDIYRELDRQVGQLVQMVGSETSIMVFSLHGMRPALGIPSFLSSWLCEKGFCRLNDWRTQTWRGRTRTSFAGVKRYTPSKLKKLYYRTLPREVTYRLASPTMLPDYDWANTTAFALPTDQHGWVRVNLIGRESQGTVPAAKYDDTCNQLERMLLNLRSDRGDALVDKVIRVARNGDEAMAQQLPDLVVHWSDAVFSPQLRIADSKVQGEMIGKKYVGQHALEGFCILNSESAVSRDEVRAEDLHLIIADLLRARRASSASA